jgi:xylitol oxidase
MGSALCVEQETNWAGNVAYFAPLSTPATQTDAISLVNGMDHVRLVGIRHSFNNISQLEDVPNAGIVSTVSMNKIISCDAEKVTVEAGVTYEQLGPYLHSRGLAIPNYASLPYVTVAGVVSTSTHGSGEDKGSLSTAIRKIKMLAGTGEIVTLERGVDPAFRHAAAAIGTGGMILELEVDVEPTFDINQCVYESVKTGDIIDDLDELISNTYSFSIFTQYRDDTLNSVWRKLRVESDDLSEVSCPLLGTQEASEIALHPIVGLSNEGVSPVGRNHSYVSLPHFVAGATPSAGAELQSEYFVPRRHAKTVIRTLMDFQERTGLLAPLLQTSEVRFVKGDSLTMSPMGVVGDCAGFHFTWQLDQDKVLAILPVIEELLAPFNPVPHWGKIFTMPASGIMEKYGEDKIRLFREEWVDRYDPEGKFSNRFTSFV